MILGRIDVQDSINRGVLYRSQCISRAYPSMAITGNENPLVPFELPQSDEVVLSYNCKSIAANRHESDIDRWIQLHQPIPRFSSKIQHGMTTVSSYLH